MMDKETYVRAILECNFAGFKDEIIEIAVRRILEYEGDKTESNKPRFFIHQDGKLTPLNPNLRTHELKILPQWFDDVRSGKKNFEIRKADRDYKVGDYLILREWYHGKFTERYLIKQIEYIYQGDGSYGISEEYCILGIKKPEEQSEAFELDKTYAALKDIMAEMNAKMEEADRNCKNSNSLSVRSWCRERAQAFDDAMKIVDRKIAEVGVNHEV